MLLRPVLNLRQSIPGTGLAVGDALPFAVVDERQAAKAARYPWLPVAPDPREPE